jgi:hypothetical protein
MFVVYPDNVAVHFICNTSNVKAVLLSFHILYSNYAKLCMELNSSLKREFLIYYEWTGSAS